MEGRAETNAPPVLAPWDPLLYLPKVTEQEIAYSRGFLRCLPQQWFPGLALQWLTLTHSLGLEVKFSGVTTTVTPNISSRDVYLAKIGQEEIAVALDEESALLLTNAIVPGAPDEMSRVIEEYLARRLLTSLIVGWSGPEAAPMIFQGPVPFEKMHAIGAVVLNVSVNGFSSTVTVLLSQRIVEQLDGMWRRQLRSTLVERRSPGALDLELTQLAVKPAALSDYATSGTMIDLEIPVSDTVEVRLGAQEAYAARLRIIDKEFVIETSPQIPAKLSQPEGTVKVALRFGSFRIESGVAFAEMLQPGALVKTGVLVSDSVGLIVNNEQISSARICVFDQRFAITVE